MLSSPNETQLARRLNEHYARFLEAAIAAAPSPAVEVLNKAEAARAAWILGLVGTQAPGDGPEPLAAGG